MASPYALTGGVNGRGGTGYGDHTHVIGYEASRFATERYGPVTMTEGAMAITLAFTHVVNASYLGIQGGSDFQPYIDFSTSATGRGSNTSNMCRTSTGAAPGNVTSFTTGQLTLAEMVTPNTSQYMFCSRNGATYGWRYWMDRVTITVNIPAGCVHIWNGSKWLTALPYIWNGSKWLQAIPYIWNGSKWLTCG